LKIGALNFNDELNLIREIRSWGSEEELTIRIDANGAFALEDAMNKLNQLSEYKLHSIEQPIKAGHLESMFKLCAESPVPVAFDEELIGSNPEDFEPFLSLGKPSHLVVKPSLHGGYTAAEKWKAWADKHGIGFWITSSLESNVGLNHLANWVCKMKLEGVQGLGTGSLFSNNSEAKWEVEGERLIPSES
jgi:L-alanine-DL-glutamate epimerase-like enolase superfamily enzyme